MQQSVGKIVQRAPAVGAKTWCLCHAPRPARCSFEGCSSNMHCVAVCRPISTRFLAFFSEWIALSGALHSSHFLSLGGATTFAKLRSKIAKNPKIGVKVCAHDFVQIAERF